MTARQIDVMVAECRFEELYELGYLIYVDLNSCVRNGQMSLEDAIMYHEIMYDL